MFINWTASILNSPRERISLLSLSRTHDKIPTPRYEINYLETGFWLLSLYVISIGCSSTLLIIGRGLLFREAVLPLKQQDTYRFLFTGVRH
ncbi:uncharacterized protein LAJ45_09486 [Morchella importuna]|uniref:uncharacterized protein n=1 Tax=Morchella importuna TaxID=1174673 RepID=UPI001E8E869E|nr:uncharacterized protein LAJ45_09486 [Morchella importuna]KAH8146540.1 hypothetical protein LAJ45_09486 [Morchella importuna]